MRPQVFLLDEDPHQCAEMYSDEHLVASIPVLIEVMRAVNAEKHPFKHHILTRWCGSEPAYNWVNVLVAKMIKEMHYRFEIDTEQMLEDLHTLRHKNITTKELPKRWLQLVPKAIQGQPIKAYQEFYCNTQQGATWTKRGAPSWFKGPEQSAFTFNL